MQGKRTMWELYFYREIIHYKYRKQDGLQETRSDPIKYASAHEIIYDVEEIGYRFWIDDTRSYNSIFGIPSKNRPSL